MFFLLILVPGLALAQKPRIFYTDLDSGPNTGGQSGAGAFVTLYGNFFGSFQGSSTVTVGGGAVSSYPVWSNTQVTVQLGSSAATGNIVLTTSIGASNGIPFTVRSGNIYFVSTGGSDSAAGSYSAPWLTLTHARDTIAAGDIVYAENGVAQTTDDGAGWNSCFTIGGNAGSAGKPKAMVVYPGAMATIGNVNSTTDGGCDSGIRAKGEGESYWTFAGFTLRGGSIAIYPYGETDWRIVANDVSCPNGNAEAGCMHIAYGTGTYIYGNNIHNIATNLSPGSVTALYHGVYISEFNTALDFGWNTIAYVEGGRGLQQNVNAGSSSYNLLIHDNIIHDTQLDGIVMTTVDPSKGPVEIYNNLIYNTGTGPANAEDTGTWTCMNLQAYDPSGYGPGSDNYQVYNNSMYNCGNWTDPPYGNSEGMLIFEPVSGTSKGVLLTNNIIYASTVSPYCADSNDCNSTSGSNNIFYGNGAAPTNSNITDSINSNPDFTSLSTPNFQLESGSPAIDAGVTESSVVTDFQGLTRPQGTAYDIGAYEVYSGGGGSTMTLSASPTSLAFGNVVDGSNSSLETTITNTGNEDVTISSASISGTGYTITSQPSYPDVLATNDTATYTVKFAPTSSGSASGTLAVASNATNSPTNVSLSGTGCKQSRRAGGQVNPGHCRSTGK